MAYLSSRIAAVFIGLMFAFGQSLSFAQERFNTQEIEQMVAPIALYPDSLLSQVLMAATYPLDVVLAARWRAQQSRSLTDQQLSVLLENQPWDPSVKSVAAFPDVLAMMNDKIDWTSRLGDAFLDQQDEVMDAVQRLRARARQAGYLASSPQQRVVVSGSPSVIVIEPAQPEVIYVPVYNPLLVYGVWPYSNYRPYYWYPPSYVASGTVFGFSAGLIVGRALWSSYDWGHRNVYINVNRYNSFNRTRITSPQWHHQTRYRSEDYRRGYARPGNNQFNGQRRPGYDRNNTSTDNNFQGRPSTTPSRPPASGQGDRNDRGSRGDRNGVQHNTRNQGAVTVPDRTRNPGSIGTPDRSRDPGRTGRPDRVRDPAASSPDRVRNPGGNVGAESRPSRVRPDAAPRAHSPPVERSRPQPAARPRMESPRVERPPRSEAPRPNVERQARPQVQGAERPERSAPSRGRPDEGQRPQR